jgi:DNA-binding IclR family transcriptional regulator
MLSTLPSTTVDNLFKDGALLRLTIKSHKTLEKLHRDLSSVRKRGYAIDKEETREGMCCIGAPVFSMPNAPATAAIAISMLKVEFGTAKRDAIIETVLTLARNLSERLGGIK